MDLFQPCIPATILQSEKLRVVPVIGDCMEPTLRSGYDYALIKPTTSYQGEGIYIIDNGRGFDFYRVSGRLGDQLRLSRDNPSYGEFHCSKEQFETKVCGIVVADIKLRNERMLLAA